MKHLTAATALVLVLAAAGCSDDADSETDTAAPVAEESEPAAEPSQSAAPSESAAGGGNVLTGIVGSESDPDAFEISLMDSAGEEVTSLPAGEYTIDVNDLSTIHNFHITGAEVDEGTTVPETGEQSFTVTFTAGDYQVVCDPHPRMVQDFTVS